jgi:hypothetical protein
VTLIGMMALVENYHRKVFDLHEPVFEHVVELLLGKNQNVKCLKLSLPVLVLILAGNRLLALLVVSRELADKKVGVGVDCVSLLLHKVRGRHHKCNFRFVVLFGRIHNSGVFSLDLRFVLFLYEGFLSEDPQDQHDCYERLTTSRGHEDDRPIVIWLSTPLLINQPEHLPLVLSQLHLVSIGFKPERTFAIIQSVVYGARSRKSSI